MVLRKWNYETHRYENHEVPDGSIVTRDWVPGQTINCASCGKWVKSDDAYVSLAVHDCMGIGYLVCWDCHKQEVWSKCKES